MINQERLPLKNCLLIKLTRKALDKQLHVLHQLFAVNFDDDYQMRVEGVAVQ